MFRRYRAQIRAAVVIGACGVLALLTLPAARSDFIPSQPPQGAAPVLAGAFHVHTNRSGGSASVEDVAAAAADAGLAFVIFAEHGDATRPLEPPRYHAGVLCLDGVEISTTGGHYIALGLNRAPYPLAGAPYAVAEDVARLGGFGVIAHPSSPKPELRWRDWGVASDGLEWLNGDTQWRDESIPRLAAAMVHYPVRPVATLGSLLDRPLESLLRWDALTQRRRVVALAGIDAHGAIPLPIGADARLPVLPIPSYEQAFRSFAVRVSMDEAMSGDPVVDGGRLLEAIRAGRVFSGIDALAVPGIFEFTAESGGVVARMGDRLEARGAVEVRVRADVPPRGEIHLYRDGYLVDRSSRRELRYVEAVPLGVFRAEVVLSGAPGDPAVPWIVSNPIYVGLLPPTETGDPAAGRSVAIFTDEGSAEGWTIEHEAESLAAVDSTESVDGQELAFRYALSGEEGANPFAAAVWEGVTGLGAYQWLRLRVRADKPQRLSIQLRDSAGEPADRWQHSVYADGEGREVIVRFRDLAPVGETRSPQPDLEAEGLALLFVVDTVNTPAGSAGVIWLDDIRLESR